MDILEIRTRAREEMTDLTGQVAEIVAKRGLKDGLCVVFVPHTTAAVTINENADPDVKSDILMALRKAVPDTLAYEHAEGNSPAHVKASLVGPAVTVIVADGRLQLGTWQGICFCEFDGPRARRAWVQVLDAR